MRKRGYFSWAILFSHPADYTPVCTTELARVAQLMPEFQKRNVKCIALSCDSVESHRGWIEVHFVLISNSVFTYLQDVKAYGKVSSLGYPIIADEKRELAVELGMLDAEEKSAEGWLRH